MRRNQNLRHGTTTVEMAMVSPILFFFVLAIIEFGHAQMAINVLNSACRNGARMGSVEGTTTSQVVARVDQTLSSAFETASASILVKDASVFDSSGSPPSSGAEVEALPNLEVGDAEPLQLFAVRASVPYNKIALVPMPFMEGVVLDGQMFMRHE